MFGNLTQHHSETFNLMINMLRSIGRKDCLVLWQAMNTKSYGCTNSTRIYLESASEGTQCLKSTRFPSETATVAYHNVCRALQKLLSKGTNPLECPSVCDHHSSKGGFMLGVPPCLTASRASIGGHWLMHRGRSMTTTVMFKLQGLCPSRWVRPADVSERQLRFAVAKALTGNIVDLLLHVALPVIGVPLQGQSKWWNPKAATRSLI